MLGSAQSRFDQRADRRGAAQEPVLEAEIVDALDQGAGHGQDNPSWLLSGFANHGPIIPSSPKYVYVTKVSSVPSVLTAQIVPDVRQRMSCPARPLALRASIRQIWGCWNEVDQTDFC